MSDTSESILNIDDVLEMVEPFKESMQSISELVKLSQFDVLSNWAKTSQLLTQWPAMNLGSWIDTSPLLKMAQDAQEAVNASFGGMARTTELLSSVLAPKVAQVSGALSAAAGNMVSVTDAINSATKPYLDTIETAKQQINFIFAEPVAQMWQSLLPRFDHIYKIAAVQLHEMFSAISRWTEPSPDYFVGKWILEASTVDINLLRENCAYLRDELLTASDVRHIAHELVIKSTILCLRKLDSQIAKSYQSISAIKSPKDDYSHSKSITRLARNFGVISQKTRQFQRNRLPDWLLSGLAAKLNHKARYLISPRRTLYVDSHPILVGA